MRAPVSWIREYADLPADVTPEQLAARLTMLGLKLESLTAPGADVSGPLVVGRVLSYVEEEHSNGRTIRWCRVGVGPEHDETDPGGGPAGRGIVCGARNFAVGDLVVVALPGTVLPGDGPEEHRGISARKTYGHVSDGMICSPAELGLGDDAGGILVLAPGEAEPGADAVALLGIRDHVIEMEINPDRAYALSLRGVAREAAMAYGVPFADPAGRTTPAPNTDGYPVRLEATDGCPLFVTRTVTGFDPTVASPRWLARRVQLAGMRSISLAVDVTNYVMLELGNPIHGYDADRLSGPIVVRRATHGERLTTLDGVDRALSADDLLITDDSGPIGLAGVMGGATTELGPSSRTVLIEAAHFTPVGIFRTARRHKLPTEGAKRWERGVDPELPAAAADRVAELLVRHGGGTVDPGVTVVGSAPAREVIMVAADLPARVTGVDISAPAAVDALRAVGCVVDAGPDEVLTVTPPPWRPDVTDPYDLVEEVARVVGYDQVPSLLPVAPAGRGLTTAQRLRRRVGRAVAGLGYTEVLAYPFVGAGDLDALGLPADDPRRSAVRVTNPLSDRAPLLHTTLAPALLGVLGRNAGRGFPGSPLSLLARVFRPGGRLPAAPVLPVDRGPTDAERAALDAALPDQPYHLALVVGADEGSHDGAEPWRRLLAAVRDVGRQLALPVELAADATAPWHPGRCARVVVDGEVVGHAGELHPRVCRAYGVPARTGYAEVDLDAMLARAPDVVLGPALSTYPVAKADVALVVDEAVAAGSVESAVRTGAGELLESVRLFDVYRGDPVPPGSKSLAYALRFRAPDRTLTDQEVSVARDAAVEAAATAVGAKERR